MEKKPKKPKKPINVDFSIGKTEIHIERDIDGNVDVDVDSKVIDAHFSKDENGIELNVELDDKLFYSFVANGSKHFKAGEILNISGKMVKHFIKQGFGKLNK